MAKKTITGETKSAKFLRLANKRGVQAVKKIRQIGSLAGRTYEWKQEQVDKLFAALATELKAANSRFNKDALVGGEEIKLL